MKKILLCILVAVLLLLSSCSVFVQQRQPETLNSYPKETAPSQIIKTENRWVMLNNAYENPDYTISVGEDFDNTNSVYSTKNVSIWYIDANENGVVWCEKSTEFYSYKTYAFNTQTVEIISQIPVGDDFQPQNVGIYLGSVYFCFIDYEQQEVRAMVYDLESKETSIALKAPFKEENQPYSINLEDEFLSFVCSEYVKVIDLKNDKAVFESDLPQTVQHVFTVSYDSINDTCALYYTDGKSEDIGILKEGEDNISSVFTFATNHYAYHDTIQCSDGHIYWIDQANVSGNISDHYTLVDYNYLENKPTETDKTFEFYLDKGVLYSLRFNKSRNYTDIELCKY